MAIKNIEVNVKTDSGYDQLNFKTDSPIISYSNTHMTATNVKDAIDELYSEKAEKTNAEFTNSISMGRKYGTTIGTGSTVIGNLGEASAENSFHSGNQNKSTGINSFTSGLLNTASGQSSEAGGQNCRAEGLCSRAKGTNTWARDAYSDATGSNTWATNTCASARGDTTVSNGYASVAAGKKTTAHADYSSIGGESTNSAVVLINKSSTDTEYISAWSNNKFSVTKGRATRVGGMDCMALADYSVAEGLQIIVQGVGANCTGRETSILESGNYSSVEGYKGISEGFAGHVEGTGGHLYGYSGHVEGYECIGLGDYSHCGGYRTIALENQYAIGHYNNTDLAQSNTLAGTSTGSAFVIGNGTADVSSNAFRVTGAGLVYAKGAYSASGADLAEIYEWQDENKANEDRRALFVTNDGTKIKIAEKGDYILGIISSAPCIIGNGDECWVGAYEKDEHGSYIYETKLIEVKRKVPTTKTIQVEEEFPIYNEETNEMETVTKMVDRLVIDEEEVIEDVAQQFYKVNPLYDPTRPYKQRLDRPEFDAVGIKGMLTLIDDGTCEVNGFCKCGGKGIATKCNREPFDTFRVIERINDKLIKVAI